MVVRTEPICLARTGPEQVRTRHQSQDCKGAAPRTGLFVEIGITVWNEKISGPNAINWSLDQLFELLAIYRAHERLVNLRPAQVPGPRVFFKDLSSFRLQVFVGHLLNTRKTLPPRRNALPQYSSYQFDRRRRTPASLFWDPRF